MTTEERPATKEALSNPVLNSPYEEPSRYFEIGPEGPTGEIKAGRRPSESFIPVPKAHKGRRGGGQEDTQLQFDLNATQEQIKRNEAIDQLRDEVGRWRRNDYPGTTPISRKLLRHWADRDRENRVFFAQREAAETAIFITEVAGRRGYSPSSVGGADWRRAIEEANATHNDGLPRLALKMATGTGKTVVMAMLIAWQTLNKVVSPHDARFVDRFLIIAPGITIRDRLGVLQPNRDDNYYDARGVVPADIRPQLGRARIAITNYHQLMQRDSNEVKGVSGNTRKLLLGYRSGDEDPFKESPAQVVSRVLKDVGGVKGGLMVFDDESHHCYRPHESQIEDDMKDLDRDSKSEARDDNEHATVWFKGLTYLNKYANLKQVFDLSATPFYLKGSGWQEGLIFPWTVSDFSLMDAIESGIVKVPRLPVDDNAVDKQVTYLHVYDRIQDDPHWPHTLKAAKALAPGDWTMPTALEGALRSLYKSYRREFAAWQNFAEEVRGTPPVMIVIAPNTAVSKLIYEWIAGFELAQDDESRFVSGNLPLFSNGEDDKRLARSRTIVVDSQQLESGDALSPDFKEAAADQIESFKREYRVQHPGADASQLTDADFLREAMNTVGKPGKLGEGIRCVVSVSMLTEGWDANTVTHILGVRAFRSQLLCEQVMGRGLRRRSYAVDPGTGLFDAEYANVYGIPFAFIPSDGPVGLDPGSWTRCHFGYAASVRVADLAAA